MTDWPALRELLLDRCRGRCELCQRPLPESWAAHHRRLRSQGGQDTPGNLVALHHECHVQVHANVAWARGHGYIVPSWWDPLDVAVFPCTDPTCAERPAVPR